MEHKTRIFGLYYSSESLRTLSKKEQQLYLVCCQNVNEIGFLSKQMLYAFNVKSSDEIPIKLAQDEMGYYNMRLLAGRLVEAWNFFSNRSSDLRKLFNDGSYPELEQDLATAKGLLGSSTSPIKLIRHRFAFHTNADFLQRQLAKHPGDQFVEFIGEDSGNTVFFGVGLMVLNAIIDAQNPDGGIEDLRSLQNDILAAAKVLMHLSIKSAAALFKTFYTEADKALQKEWTIPVPSIESVESSFFAHAKRG